MNKESEFPFERARRVTSEENQKFRQAISEQFGIQFTEQNDPKPDEDENDELISLKLHPKVLAWVKQEAKKREIDCQTVINEVLIKAIY